MPQGRLTIFELTQFAILVFTMSLMLSQHYSFFKNLFTPLYQGQYAMVCFVVGIYSILHGGFMMVRSFFKGN